MSLWKDTGFGMVIDGTAKLLPAFIDYATLKRLFAVGSDFKLVSPGVSNDATFESFVDLCISYWPLVGF